MAALITKGVVLTGGTITLLGRIVDWNGAAIVPAGVSSIKYTAYLLQDDARVPISGHTNVNLTVNDVILGSLTKDALWNLDNIGYNFRYTIDVSSAPIATTVGSEVLVAVTLTPNEGQVIRWDYMLQVA